jgi:hypothetical protein
MLIIVGTGIKRPQQLTLEGVTAIKNAKRVLHITATEQAIEALLDRLGAANRRSLEELYRVGTLDQDNYERLTREVVQEVEQWGDVALLLYGHPRLGVSVTRMLEDKLPGNVLVLPATSSFDTMINDLHRDPLERGSVLLDATRLLLFQFRLEPCLDHYIYHVDSVASRILSDAGGNGSRCDLLRDYLLRFYPAQHRVKLIGSDSGQGEVPVFMELELGQLELAAEWLAIGVSLFIPALRPKQIDREVYALLQGSAPVASIPSAASTSPTPS